MKKLGMKKLFVVALMSLIVSSAAFADNLTVDGTTRSYVKYVPSNLGENRPLLISCHGMSQNPDYQKGMLKIETVADTAKFVTVFPQGIDNAWDISGDRDINFVKAIIDKMVTDYKIDRNRVYLSGFSMGGMFTYHAMTKIADLIAAFAPISGYPMGGMSFTSARPVPIIHTHGTADDVVSFNRVQSFIDGWVKRNNCPTTARKTTNYRGASHITRYEYGPGDNGVYVVLMEMANKGHWISNDNGVLTGDEIWRFCKEYSLVNRKPTVSLSTPLTGTKLYTMGTAVAEHSIRIVANAKSDSSEIAKVAFYGDSKLLATLTEPPYEYTWTKIFGKGSHSIKVVATDKEGETATAVALLNALIKVKEMDLSADFEGGAVPAGWMTYDGEEKRVGTLANLYSGCRVLAMTGEPRDFDLGLYIRNKSGNKEEGIAYYATDETSVRLALTPAKYSLNFTVCNWNMTGFGAITARVKSTANGVLVKETITPTCNIGNSASNSFSGATKVELPFEVTVDTPVYIAFFTDAAPWADAIIADIKLVREDPTSVESIVDGTTKIEKEECFNLSGRSTGAQGLVLKRTTYADGKVKVEKVLR